MDEYTIISDLTTDEAINEVWKKGTIVEGYDSDIYRKDAAGAWIMRSMYGKRTGLGWEIDHVYPSEKGGLNHLVNLRPMHWRNNVSKSDDYPGYTSVVTATGNSNEYKDEYRTVNDTLRQKLDALYD